MPNAKEIRTKISSIKKTQKITRAMEMVAASKMRKAQDRMQTTRPYAAKIQQVISHLSKAQPEYRHKYLAVREIKRVGIIIISTDRGLCGGLNSSLFKKILNTMKAYNEKSIETEMCLVGTKAEHFFRRIGGTILAHAGHLGDSPSAHSLVGVVKVMLDAYENGHLDSIHIAYNSFVNTMQQAPTIQQLLPLVPAETEKTSEYHWDYIYEPDAKILLTTLMSRYIESLVYQGVVENLASEQASRMVAMKNASENAGEIISELQLVYNKARQASITKELSEIVAGAEAV